ncbi:MAG TPA: DoxX family protein [Actinomycetes bacterium]|jgi:thiosulfate dehydrogenase [quinone] large subunit|nr:DoxX family protein [Actinomycetes bacterium]
MAMTDRLRAQQGSGPVYFEEPRLARWLLGSSAAAWIWLIARLWLGWEWFQSGWGKVFGGNITWRFWNWSDSAYSLTGSGSIGWIRSGTVGGQHLAVGDSVAGFAKGALASGTRGAHPDVAYSWYVNFLEWVRDSGHTFLGPLVAIGEITIGIMLILGLFTGIVAFLGAILNFSFVFAGSAGVNPAMIIVAVLLILAWRNAGWYGLDRAVLPRFGTPWQAGALFHRAQTRPPTVGGAIGQT